ncbi:MAG: YncE family protein [Candidatus Binatia bacterium]
MCAYVANGGAVSVIDTHTNSVSGTIALRGCHARDITVSSTGDRAYVACGKTIAVIDTQTNTVVGSISVAPYVPTRLTVTPDGRFIYA